MNWGGIGSDGNVFISFFSASCFFWGNLSYRPRLCCTARRELFYYQVLIKERSIVDIFPLHLNVLLPFSLIFLFSLSPLSLYSAFLFIYSCAPFRTSYLYHSLVLFFFRFILLLLFYIIHYFFILCSSLFFLFFSNFHSHFLFSVILCCLLGFFNPTSFFFLSLPIPLLFTLFSPLSFNR